MTILYGPSPTSFSACLEIVTYFEKSMSKFSGFMESLKDLTMKKTFHISTKRHECTFFAFKKAVAVDALMFYYVQSKVTEIVTDVSPLFYWPYFHKHHRALRIADSFNLLE